VKGIKIKGMKHRIE